MQEEPRGTRVRPSPLLDRVHLFLKPGTALPALPADPLHSDVPALRHAEIAAVYHGQRVAGDFYEFLRVGPSRVLFGLFDIAGRREGTREILIAAQTTFRTHAPQLFAAQDFNESDAMIELVATTRIWVPSATPTPATPPACCATRRESPGWKPPACRSASSPIPPAMPRPVRWCRGAILLIVSRGIVKVECDGEEFGLEGASASLGRAPTRSARDLCLTILHAAHQFTGARPTANDVTALALVRTQST
jgi:hypothetical protein